MLDKDKRPQHQGSVTEQLQELVYIANREGLYDAADFINNYLNEQKRKEVG